MKLSASLLAALFLLSGCGNGVLLPGLPGNLTTRGVDAESLGGLSDDEAAHPSVEAQAPSAFVLTSEGQSFLQALSRSVEPQRRLLAEQLLADTTVSQGLSRWASLSGTSQLNVLKRVAAIEGQVMNFQVPPIDVQTSNTSSPSTIAYYQPGDTDIGQVVLYSQAIAQGGKYLALATLVHEMRHAAQYQLTQSNSAFGLLQDADAKTLSTAYNAAWQVMGSLGSESSLAYGDYAHLAVEYDAFQTGHEVAALVSEGSFDGTGYGFVDERYDASATPKLDLLTLSQSLTGSDLVQAVNQAEYKAERAHGGTMPGPRQRPQPIFRRGGRGFGY